MNPLLKHRLKKFAAATGIRRRYRADRQRMSGFCRHLKQLGFLPRSIIDVGVADGTFEIYEVFPDAKYLLVEPMQEFLPALRSISKRIDAAIELVAAGNIDEHREIRFPKPTLADLHGATLASTTYSLQSRVIQSRRLDGLIRKHGLVGPMLLKVDTQGTELDVLNGAGDALELIDVVILEVSFFECGMVHPLVDEVWKYMLDRGFYPFDIFNRGERPVDNSLAEVDIAFVRRDGMFRRDQRYADLAAPIPLKTRLFRILRHTLGF